jgi:hypothetical protein
MSWQPNQAGLQQIVGLLTEFQQPGADQHKVSGLLDRFDAFAGCVLAVQTITEQIHAHFMEY